MVVLNRIYTRTGDDGTTALGSGERRKKYDLRVSAYGTLDEVNAVIGVARLHTAATTRIDAVLARIQNDLFDVEADLCLAHQGAGRRRADRDRGAGRVAGGRDRPPQRGARAAQIVRAAGRQPGRGLSASRAHGLPARRAHHGRTQGPAGRGACRRTRSNTSTGCPIFLFVASRFMNDKGATDVLWAPGQNR